MEPGKDYFVTVNQDLNADLRKSILRKISKRQINVRLKNLERFWAMLPDSTVTGNIRIDSFYCNQSKISYIEANELKTQNIHFLR